MIDYSAGSGNGRVEQRPAPASAGESLTNARHAFRIWRRTRPFWGGLLVIVAALEMLVSEQAPLPVVTHLGIQGLDGYLTPTFMLLCGVLLWLISVARIYHSLLAILLALDSWITSNLGGFLIGMLIGVVGGALAFAWTTDAHYRSYGWLRKPQIGLPSWARDLIPRLKERTAALSEGRGAQIGVHLARLHRARARAAAALPASTRKIIASAAGRQRAGRAQARRISKALARVGRHLPEGWLTVIRLGWLHQGASFRRLLLRAARRGGSGQSRPRAR